MLKHSTSKKTKHCDLIRKEEHTRDCVCLSSMLCACVFFNILLWPVTSWLLGFSSKQVTIILPDLSETSDLIRYQGIECGRTCGCLFDRSLDNAHHMMLFADKNVIKG